MMGGKNPIPIAKQGEAAQSCFIAAAMYAFVTLLCSWQSWLHKRQAKQAEVFGN